MRAPALLLILSLLSGCIEQGCLHCDDKNPCTTDQCVEGVCRHTLLSGPVEGCSSSGGCVEYGCFSGECIPRVKARCCGNGACDEGETYMSCPKDCKATCYDGVRNQGEEGIDCGGPCNPCESPELMSLRKLGAIRALWYDSAMEYTDAIKAYNRDNKKDALLAKALSSYGDAQGMKVMLAKAETPENHMPLKEFLNRTMELYTQSLNSMSLYLQDRGENYRTEANRLLSDSLDNDRIFVREYNLVVQGTNNLESNCLNYRLDPGEESVDCGGVCRTKCEYIMNVTKTVTFWSEGGASHIVLNISSPAIEYPPTQRILAEYARPKPNWKTVSEEGNLYFAYEFNMPAYGVRVFDITQTVRFYKIPAPVKSESKYFNSVYLVENNLSRTTDDICWRARQLRNSTKSNAKTAENILDWMINNINYEVNEEELGAEYCYINHRGACDEHADLFVSMARCDGIPARRVTGNLVNASQLNGHAWAEYYDNGWVYVDPSIKKHDAALASDNKHMASCVGEGAYHCGTSYAYTYSGKRPKIQVDEQVYVG